MEQINKCPFCNVVPDVLWYDGGVRIVCPVCGVKQSWGEETEVISKWNNMKEAVVDNELRANEKRV